MRGIVAIAGVAAALLAGCGSESATKFDKYRRGSIAVEAKVSLHSMASGARTYYQSLDQLPAQSAGPTPPLGACCKSPSKPKCAPDAALWANDPVWRTLDFHVEVPHFYSYEYKRTESGFEAAAYGDIDCDGEYATFLVTGTVDGASGELTVSSRPTTVNPEE